MTTEELEGVIGRLIKVCTWDEEESDSIDDILDHPECWFDIWDYKKTGYGMKCRDLLTGEELFLIDRSGSQITDAKGRTLCLGIVPMEDVYLLSRRRFAI